MDARRRIVLRHARGPLGALALVLLCCTVYLPGFFSIPPVDRDESRFAQASRQMFESVALPAPQRDPILHSGGLAVPMLQGKERLNKPPLIYWLQAASAAVFTAGDPLKDAIWMYRVPSLLAGIVTILATWRIGVSMFDPRAGWLAAALLAVAPVFVWEAHQARADMVMVAFTSLSMQQLWRIWRRERTGSHPPVSLSRCLASSLLLWLPTTLGILTKGPITPVVLLLTALTLSVLSRNFRWLRATRPLLGLAVIAAGVAPWVYAVAQHVGFAHYWSIVYDEVLVRASGAKEGHWGPPGYHIVLLVVLFWPGSLLTGLAIARAWHRAFTRVTHPAAASSSTSSLRLFVSSSLALRTTPRPEAFLLAWFLPSWIVFELLGTKLPHYTMPLYPAVALITARGLLAWPSFSPERRRRARFGSWCWLAVGLAILALVGLGLSLGIEGPLAWLGLLLLAASLLLFGPTMLSIRREDLIRAQAWSLAAGVAMLTAFLMTVAPNFFGLSRWAEERARILAPGRPVTWVGFAEDSVVWFARGRPSFTPPDQLLAWFDSHPDGLAIVSVYAEESYLSSPDRLEPVELAFGVHYVKGRLEYLAFVERVPE